MILMQFITTNTNTLTKLVDYGLRQLPIAFCRRQCNHLPKRHVNDSAHKINKFNYNKETVNQLEADVSLIG